MAVSAGGDFLLRIEDIDGARARPEFEAAIRADLTWLGLRWPEPVMRQSQRSEAYAAAMSRLRDLDVLYPCTCTRRGISSALGAPQEGAAAPVYPGTCRGRRDAPPDAAWRLDLARARALAGPVGFRETGPDRAAWVVASGEALGDVVLARRDIGVAYHLAVVVDDAAQRISHVVRGSDLFEATGVHRLLQALLGLPTPVYHHHRLIRDAAGWRLAKRDDAASIASRRAAGATPADLRALVGL